MPRAGDSARLELLTSAYVEQERGSVTITLPLANRRAVDELHLEALGDVRRARLGTCESFIGWRTSDTSRTVFAGIAGQFPSHGAVFERHDIDGVVEYERSTRAAIEQKLGELRSLVA